jgi:hypothetical protein
MKGLSSEIESGIRTVIEGLNYEINLDYRVRDFKEFVDFVGYNAAITNKKGYKTTGEIIEANRDSVLLKYFVKDKKERVATTRSILHEDIKDARVYEKDGELMEADKMKAVVDSKITSFSLAKQMLHKWVGSPNAPKAEKLRKYVTELVEAGDKALQFLREALAYDIDYDSLDTHKFSSAIKAKPVIMNGMFDLEESLSELRNQLDTDTLNLSDREFKVGYPERFAKGEFFPKSDYHKEWYNAEEDAVMICPKGTKGEIIVLQDLKIQLPKPPRKKKDILFSDKKPEDQYWRRIEPPAGITPDNQESFADYIMEEFRRRREGVWFMNNGEKVYLTGNHYFALQWCKMKDDGKYMSFRYAQLRMFYHLEACIVDKRCLGQVFLKSRRTGFTYVILSILQNMSTSIGNAKYGMTSKSGDDVQEAFDKFSYMFLSLPFFFRPVVKGKEDSNARLDFAKPSENSKEAKKRRNTGINDYLNTVIDHRPTKNDSYDSVKLDAYLGDEAFKWTKPNDYITHLGMVAPTMMPAGKVVGKAFIGSTMGSRKKGGEQGIELIKSSMVKDRDPITQKTPTALYAYFLPAQENMEEFTDKYGYCWESTPPEGTKNVMGAPILMGSVDYLVAVEEQKKRQSDAALNEQYRTYPRTMEHAMRDEDNNCIFNVTKLYDQLEHNATIPEESRYTVGDFDWKDQIDGPVMFNPNPRGRFKVSWLPSKQDGTEFMQNRVKELNGKFYPLNEDAVRFGCDPFSLKSTHGEGSKGGLHGKTLMFPEGGAPSNKFVVEYIARPPDDTIFFEDVIKVIRFYGAPILVESNRIDLLRHMRNRGYRGFAMDRLDKPKHKLNENEKEYGGQMMSGQDIIDSHMNSIGSWIQKYVGKSTDEKYRTLDEIGDMPFNETLMDWLAFDPSERTKYDATISSGLAIMACQTEKYKGKAPKKDPKRVLSLIKTYSNKGVIGKPV